MNRPPRPRALRPSWVAACVFLAGAAAAEERTAGRIESVLVEAAGTSDERVAIKTDRPTNFTSLKLARPPRVVVEFPETRTDAAQGLGGTRIRKWQFDPVGPETAPVARLTLYLAEDADYVLDAEGDVVRVRLLESSTRPLASLDAEDRPDAGLPRVDAAAERQAQKLAELQAAADARKAAELARREAAQRAIAERKAAIEAARVARIEAEKNRREAAARVLAEKKAAAEAARVARIEAEKNRREAAARALAEKKAAAEAARVARIDAEKARREAYARAIAEKKSAAEAARLAKLEEARTLAERRAEAVRVAKAEEARVAEERRAAAEAARVAKAEEARLAAERRDEAARAAKAEQTRIAEERRAAAEAARVAKAEEARLAAERRDEAARAAKAEETRIAEERRAAAEAARLAAERRDEAARAARAAETRIAEERRAAAEADRIAKEEDARLAAERREEAARLAKAEETRSATSVPVPAPTTAPARPPETATRPAPARTDSMDEVERIAASIQAAAEADRRARDLARTRAPAPPVDDLPPPAILSGAETPSARKPATTLAALTGLGFRRTEAGARLFLRTSRPVEFSIRDDGRSTSIELEAASIPLATNRLPLDARFFGTIVDRVVPLEDHENDSVTVRIESSKPVRTSAHAEAEGIVVDVVPADDSSLPGTPTAAADHGSGAD